MSKAYVKHTYSIRTASVNHASKAAISTAGALAAFGAAAAAAADPPAVFGAAAAAAAAPASAPAAHLDPAPPQATLRCYMRPKKKKVRIT